MKIEERKPKTKTRTYKLLVGDNKIAELLSKISSAVIGIGFQLEKLIRGELENSDEIFCIKKPLDFEKYIIKKQTHTKKNFYFPSNLVKKYFKNKPSVAFPRVFPNPDFNFYFSINDTILVIETKIGYYFDTKKIPGEIASIEKYIKFLKNNLSNRKYKWFFCAWLAKNIDDLEKGTKGLISRENLIIRSDFKKLININTSHIEKKLMSEEDQIANVKYIREIVNKNK